MAGILKNIQRKIFMHLRDNENITTDEMSKLLSISKRYTLKIISQLKQLGYIERIGKTKSGNWIFLK